MNYPSINEYKEALLFTEDNFEQLKNLRPVLDDEGNPVMTGGNFAEVFKMKDEQTGKLYAVKCFLREQEGRAEAYRQIAEELEYVSSTFLTPIKYLDKELFVDTNAGDEKEFPVLLMDWVEGDTLDKYIRKHLDDQYELSLLAYQFSRLAMWLMPQPFAHGDLKPDNILVKSDGTLVLVDYDGMYVPAMKGQKSRELGSPDFRHPSRTETVFDEHIDDFSLASILLSLKAISLLPSLLEEYGASDRLLFSDKDYRNLSESKVMDALKPLMHDAELASLYSLFILASSQNNLSQVSFRLFNLSRPERIQYEVDNLSTIRSWEDMKNSWTDEFGVKYSNDGVRLLYAPSGLKNYVVRSGTKIICDTAFSFYSIGDNGEFYDCSYNTDLVSVTFPNSLLIIGDRAFGMCSQLESVKIPEGVISIGYRAFENCEKLSQLELPNSLKEIGSYAFHECLSLRSVCIPNSVVSIGNHAFGYCHSLKSITLSSNMINIEEETFRGCEILSSISIPDGIKSIGKNAFYVCENLLDVKMSNSVLEIGNGAFQGCKRMQSITISDNLTVIGERAFQYCEALNHIYLPNSIKTIGYSAFYGCSSLKQINIPNSITKFEDEVFALCPIENIIIPNSVVEIGSRAFWGCGITHIDIPQSVKEIGDGAFYRSGLKSIKLPDSIHVIKEESFYDCFDISEVTIPNTIVKIGGSAFLGCNSLTRITLPNTIKEIGPVAFQFCDSLVEIDIPNSVSRIENGTFEGCTSLKRIDIPESITFIGACAFRDCTSLESIKLPKSISVVENDIFMDCDALKQIIIPRGTNEKFEKILTDYKDKLIEQDEVENLNTEVTDEDFANAWADKYGVMYSADKKRLLKAPDQNLIHNYSVTYGTQIICNKAFRTSEYLRNIIIPSSVTQIGDEAFAHCQWLNCVNLPNSIKQIGNSAFDGCVHLEEINIPNTITQIGNLAFESCAIKHFIIPQSMIYMGQNPFAGCEKIASLTCKSDNFIVQNQALFTKDMHTLISWICKDDTYQIPSLVNKIGDYAFSENETLRYITIPDSVDAIGKHAFSMCRELRTVYISNIDIQIDDGAFFGCYELKRIVIPKGTWNAFADLLPDHKRILLEK